MTTRQRQEQQTGKYRELIGIAEEVLQSARMVLRNTRKTHGRDMIADMVIAETRKEIEHFCSLGARVIDQSRRRVLNGEQVPTAEKLYSATVDDAPFASEHSLEVQLPFLQRVCARPFAVLPVAIGLSTVEESGPALAAVAGRPGTVLLCSTRPVPLPARGGGPGAGRRYRPGGPGAGAGADRSPGRLRCLRPACPAGLRPAWPGWPRPCCHQTTSAAASGNTGRVVGYASFALAAHPASAGVPT